MLYPDKKFYEEVSTNTIFRLDIKKVRKLNIFNWYKSVIYIQRT